MMPVFIRVFTCVLQRFLQCLHAFRCVLSVKKKTLSYRQMTEKVSLACCMDLMIYLCRVVDHGSESVTPRIFFSCLGWTFVGRLSALEILPSPSFLQRQTTKAVALFQFSSTFFVRSVRPTFLCPFS